MDVISFTIDQPKITILVYTWSMAPEGYHPQAVMHNEYAGPY